MPPAKPYMSSGAVHSIFLFGVIGILLILTFLLLSPFLTTVFMAAIVATGVMPLVDFLIEKRKWNRIVAVLGSFVGIILLILVPVTLLVASLVGESLVVSQKLLQMSTGFQGKFEAFLMQNELIQKRFPFIIDKINFENFAIVTGDVAGKLSGTLIKSVAGLIKHISIIVLHAVIFLFALCYFLLDGKKIVKYIKKLLPLSTNQKTELFRKIKDLMHAIIFGMFGAALAQGIVLGIGLAIAGIENAIFWAAVATLLAPIPYIGIGIVWIPTVAWLFMNGTYGTAIFLLAWCLIFVVNIDNIVKPLIIGSRSMLHPFAIMLVIFGGILSFGFKGLIFGPLILTLLFAFLHIYELEYVDKKAPKI